MANQSFYQPGRKAQYGAERWARYESLRQSGFTKSEARELSRANSPQAFDVIKTMAKQREHLQSEFIKIAKERGWTGSNAYMRFVAGIRKWYAQNNLTSKQGRAASVKKGGKPDLWIWYHRVENRKAVGKGWRKGTYDPSTPTAERQSRRPKRKTPPHNKGNVNAQKARAKERGKSFRDLAQSEDSPTVRRQKRQWITELRKTAKAQPERDAQLTEQARRLGFTGNSLLKSRRTKS